MPDAGGLAFVDRFCGEDAKSFMCRDVHGRQRLVEQQHPEGARERPAERDTLALATRQSGCARPSEQGEPEAVEQLRDPAPGGGAADPIGHVLLDGEVREQRRRLADKGDLPVARRER